MKKFEADMSDYNTLKNLLDFAAKAYNPKSILLTLSDHGAGHASTTGAPSAKSVCTDDTTGTGLKDSCKFVKETNWLPLLKRIMPQNAVSTKFPDEISGL